MVIFVKKVSFCLVALVLLLCTACSKTPYIIQEEQTSDGKNSNLQTSRPGQVDPFEGLSVSFDGVSPYCTVSLNNSKCSEAVQKNVEYSLSPDRITIEGYFAMHDTVKVYASVRRPYGASTEQSLSLSVTEKTYSVENVPRYITEITDDMDFTQLKREAADYLAAFTAWKAGDGGACDTGGYFVSSSGLTNHDDYFSVLKLNAYSKFKKKEADCFNRIDLMYSVVIETEGYSGGVYHRYFTIYATNVVQYPDGKIGWGKEDPAALDFAHKINQTSLDDLINENIVSKKADYNAATISDRLKQEPPVDA